MIRDQAAAPRLLTIDVVTFDDEIEHTHSFAQPAEVTIDLVPRGSTALYDAVGLSLNGFGGALGNLPEHARPGTVLVTIVTDGEENASSDYTAGTIKQIGNHQREVFDWDISFLGANQDAVLEAQKIGVDPGDALDYDLGAVGSSMIAHSAKLSRCRQGDKTGYTAAERLKAAGYDETPTPPQS